MHQLVITSPDQAEIHMDFQEDMTPIEAAKIAQMLAHSIAAAMTRGQVAFDPQEFIRVSNLERHFKIRRVPESPAQSPLIVSG